MTYLDRIIEDCVKSTLLKIFLRTFRITRPAKALNVAVLGKIAELQVFNELTAGDPLSIATVTYLDATGGIYNAKINDFDYDSCDLLLVVGDSLEQEQSLAQSLTEKAKTNSSRMTVFFWGTLQRILFQTLESFEELPTCLNFEKLFAVSSALFLANPSRPVFECGVYGGGLTILLAKLFQNIENNSKIYAFDTFEGMPEPVKQDIDAPFFYPQGFFGDTSIDLVRSRYERAGVINQIEIKPGLIENTLNATLDSAGSPGLAILDMDSYSAIGSSLRGIAAFRRCHPQDPPTLVIIDDYSLTGVTLAVKEVAADYEIDVFPITHNLVGLAF